MFDARAIFDGPGPYYASALWQQHQVQRLAPDGAAEALPAALQIVSERWQVRAQVPYLVHMPERDRLAILAQCEHQPVIITSDDRGATWSRPRFVSRSCAALPIGSCSASA